MASYEIVSYTSTTVTFRATGLTPGYIVRFFIRLPNTETATKDTKGEYVAGSNQTEMTVTIDGLTPNTIYVCNVSHTSALYLEGWIGAKSFLTWGWTNAIASGSEINITAVEWNNFTARINEFRAYRGMGTVTFTTVAKGDYIEAAIVNQAVNAIAEITGHGEVPDAAISGVTPITASFFIVLGNALKVTH